MSVERLLRWAGLVGIAAAALIVISQLVGLYAIDPRNLIGTVTTAPAAVFQITKLASVILLLVALFGWTTAKTGVFPRVAGVVVAIGGALAFLGGFPPYQIGLALGVGWMSGWLLVRRTAVSEDARTSSAAASGP